MPKARSVINTLKEYKEIIAILVFFIGGVLWIFGFFATKNEVKKFKYIVLTKVNIEENYRLLDNLQRELDELTEEKIDLQKRELDLMNKEEQQGLEPTEIEELLRIRDRLKFIESQTKFSREDIENKNDEIEEWVRMLTSNTYKEPE